MLNNSPVFASPRSFSPGHHARVAARGWKFQLALFAGVLAVYELSRVFALGDVSTALANAQVLIHLERRLGIFLEPSVQTALLDARFVMTFANTFYLYAHLPATIFFFFWLYRRRPEHYPMFRDSFLVMNLCAALIFALFPCAPPRLLPELGFVDTLRVQAGIDLQGGSLAGLFNAYAAFPSMHVGYAMVVGAGLVTAARRTWVRVAAAVYPLLVTSVIVVTGHHFFLDAVGGAAVVLLATFVAWRAGRAWRRRGAASSPAAAPSPRRSRRTTSPWPCRPPSA